MTEQSQQQTQAEQNPPALHIQPVLIPPHFSAKVVIGEINMPFESIFRLVAKIMLSVFLVGCAVSALGGLAFLLFAMIVK